MTKIRVDGNCKKCGAYANGINMEWHGLCMACANKSKRKFKKEMTLPNGKTIWYEDNKVGGRTWYSDEVGDGVIAWDTALVDMETLNFIMMFEKVIRKREQS